MYAPAAPHSRKSSDPIIVVSIVGNSGDNIEGRKLVSSVILFESVAPGDSLGAGVENLQGKFGYLGRLLLGPTLVDDGFWELFPSLRGEICGDGQSVAISQASMQSSANSFGVRFPSEVWGRASL